jgi:hypothetical protein
VSLDAGGAGDGGCAGVRIRRRSRLPEPLTSYPEEIQGLLFDVRQLRTTMASDLSAAAAAVDSDAGGVARDIIEADRDDLAALGRRATPPAPADRAVAPRAPAGRRPVLPLAGAAVALPCVAALAVGGAILTAHAVQHPVRNSPTHPAAAPAVVSPVAASRSARAVLRTLQADVGRGADATVVAADLTRLRARLATVTTASAGSPATLSAVRQMVAVERRTVSRYRREGGTLPVAVPTSAAPRPGQPHGTHSPRSTVRRTQSHVHHTPPSLPHATSPPPVTLPTTAPTLPGSLGS